MTENSAASFFQELDLFEIDMPGGQKIPFKNNKALLDLLNIQYPHWREDGHVTSVPIARVPRLFLHNLQMSKQLAKEFASLQKGEGGEIKLYRLLKDAKYSNGNGVVIFPNVNGREIFKSTMAHVEIDTVLTHPSKGIFVFNVKAVGGRLTPQKLKGDIERHGNFLRKLSQYSSDNPADLIPIHSVVCSMHDDNKKKFSSLLNLEHDRDQVLIFSKSELKPDTFLAAWEAQLNTLPDFDDKESFDILVARLVALNSIESSLALIHDQMASNYMQATNENKKQFDEFEFGEDKSLLEGHSLVGTDKKKRFIIWTQEQLKIIAFVTKHLLDPSRRGLRLLVTGCKGSGKTMLLVFIAKLTESLFNNPDSDCSSYRNVVVCDGYFKSPVLTELLKRLLASTGALVYEAASEILHILNNQFFAIKTSIPFFSFSWL